MQIFLAVNVKCSEIASMVGFCLTWQVESVHFILEMHSDYFLIAGPLKAMHG